MVLAVAFLSLAHEKHIWQMKPSKNEHNSMRSFREYIIWHRYRAFESKNIYLFKDLKGIDILVAPVECEIKCGIDVFHF